ncbi:MAG: phenylalanine--tRNA ligase subunit beta [Parachlamydiaceae bacterium]|nr:phenylalanine--tRNA ligase subunit beta [Parachlamydiaceae bacterium]
MKIPLSWIKEYVHLNQTPIEIAKILTSAGIEVDGIEGASLNSEGVVVGHVLEVEKHPNADKLCIAQVTDGKETFQVVCGAPNCRKGLNVAFARLGAILKDENGKNFTIKNTKIRGVESSGMLCAGDEIGISDDHDGILELPESYKVGTPLADYYTDTIFEISLTPNLGHCTCVLGIARELSAATALPIHKQKIEVEEIDKSIDDAIELTVVDPIACPRYTCRLIQNVNIGPSPEWLKKRIEQCGLRSINNVVDVTNYVLMELGHPLHAFDYDLLEGKQIIVKKALEGERFVTLDGKERILASDDLMICDEANSVAIAGVMGGSNSEVSDKTRNVLLEAAYFDSVVIRKTSKRLGLQTDSSKRFERGTDPNNLVTSLDRATMLIQLVAGGQVLADVKEFAAKEFPEKVIPCRLSRVNEMLGLNIGRGEIESIFQRLHFQSHWEDSNIIAVQVPTYRVDIQAEIDLVEEVARIYGYDNIPKKSAKYNSSVLPHAPIYLFEKEIQARLITEGLQEFLTCDLIGPALLNIVQDHSRPSESVVSVLNPVSIEQSVLRTSLLPGLLQVVKYNYDHQNHDVAGFEIGRIHFKEGNQYKEQSIAGIVLSGKAHPHHYDGKDRDYDFYDLKGIVENLLKELGVGDPIFKNLDVSTFHSGRQASLYIDSLDIGVLGEVHPSILRRLDIPQRILFAELNLHDLIQVIQRKPKVKELSKYPGTERDWTVTIKTDVPYVKVLEEIKKNGSSILEDVSVLDIYRSEKLGKEFQNMTLRFAYRDPSKTIELETVDKEHFRLISEVSKKLGDAVK